MNVHNHHSSAVKVETNTVVNKIMKRAQETQEPTSQVINPCLKKYQTCLPRYTSKSRSFEENGEKKTQSRTTKSCNSISGTLRCYDVTPEIIENFLLAVSGPALDRILI